MVAEDFSAPTVNHAAMLLELTGRSCVVYQTLARSPSLRAELTAS